MNVLQRLSGLKTYLFTIAWGLVMIGDKSGALSRIDPGILASVESALFVGAGLALRAGVQKAENAAKEAA